MQQFNKRLLFAALALLVVCGASLSSSALAREAESGSNSGSGSSNSGSGSNVKSVKTSSETENETEHGVEEVETEKSKSLKEQFRQEAKVKVQTEVKTKAQAKTLEQKQKSCTARKANLTKRMNNSVTAAEKHKANFDRIYTKVKTFYTTKNLNVATYGTLTTSVDTAQQNAADQITALKALEISVDCTQTDSLATNLTAFQTAVGSTRDSLKSYRKSLVELITQIHGASTSTAKTDSGDDSSTNDSTN